jgi:hypothetical protein
MVSIGQFILDPISTNQVCIGTMPNLNNSSSGNPIFIFAVFSAKMIMQNSKQAEALDCKMKYFSPHSILSACLLVWLNIKENVIVLISRHNQMIIQFLEEKHSNGVSVRKTMAIK